jgi:hypothetical protein
MEAPAVGSGAPTKENKHVYMNVCKIEKGIFVNKCKLSHNLKKKNR